MPIYETFAKRRQKAENASKPVIYRYDELPIAFRTQVVRIWRDATGASSNIETYSKKNWWKSVHDKLAREIPLRNLGSYDTESSDLAYTLLLGDKNIYHENCKQYLLESEDVDQVLSLIELAFRLIDNEVRGKPVHKPELWGISQDPDDAIAELNYRFREHAIGYQYEAGQIIEVSSHYLHSEAIEPAMSLLHDARFEGALEEFMNAHKHYRERNNKEAIAEALKAFESTMKTICDRRGWGYPPNATANTLIEAIFKNGLIPSEMQSHFASLRTTLESGVPTIRNRKAGHGQGSEPVEVPDYFAAYALHLTATNIVFLVNAHNSS